MTRTPQPSKKTIVLLVAAVFVTMAFAGCHEQLDGNDDGEAFILGSALPLTGALGAYGPSARNAVDLAISHVNAAGGVHGRDVRHASGDTETTEEGASGAVSQLLNVRGIHALVGPMGSGMSLAIIDQVRAAEIPMVSPSNTGPAFTTLDHGGWYHRTVPSDALQGAVMAMLVHEHGHERVSVLAQNDPYGEGFGEVFEQRFQGLGGTIVQFVRYDPAAADYSTDVQSAAADDPDAIVVIGYPDQGRILVGNAFERGLIGGDADIAWYFSEGFRSQTDFVDEIHAQQEGILEGHWGTNPEETTHDGFFEDYEARFGSSPALFADRTYDAAVLLMLAAEHCQCKDGAGIRESLRQVQNSPGQEVVYDVAEALRLIRAGEAIMWTGAAGPMEFDDVGDVTAPFATWQIVDGMITVQETGIVP